MSDDKEIAEPRLPKPRPTYHELDSYPRCLVDHYTNEALYDGFRSILKTNQSPYPLDGEHIGAQLILRDVVLALTDVSDLEATLSDRSHPQHRAYVTCQKAFGLKKPDLKRAQSR